MVENLAKSPGMCSKSPGSAPNEIPKEGVFSWERARERLKEEALDGLGKKRSCLLLLQPATWDPSARGTRGQSAHADGPRGARTIRHPSTDGLLFAPEHPVLPLFPSSCADGPGRPGGRFSRSGRTVRPTATDSPTFLYIFSLIYSEIKIWKSIFWDHCSRIMKETCHVMQYTNQI
jgi:hypothetical protein